MSHRFDTGLLCLPLCEKKIKGDNADDCTDTRARSQNNHQRAHEHSHTRWGAQTVSGSGGDGAVQKEGDQSVL